ncbi:hypothetical protein Y032_0558g3430 [Ancylostoma ceylanicum]|uniref:Uncharacterized protein n=1 Tax=Ancylostoma ceylanicum TaxID=53326 RepID=A0A016WPK7_9BILA|nr:hypothetical protein Y032_0558g3430 [Ancylostoma ceylanicum]
MLHVFTGSCRARFRSMKLLIFSLFCLLSAVSAQVIPPECSNPPCINYIRTLPLSGFMKEVHRHPNLVMRAGRAARFVSDPAETSEDV